MEKVKTIILDPFSIFEKIAKEIKKETQKETNK